MKTYIKKITPDEAARLMLQNDGNRPLSQGHVKKLASQMKDGKWLVNGETIVISDEGKLLDGQHRLAAVIEAGVEVEFLIVEGLSVAVFATLNTGKVRQASDVLAIAGYKCTTNLGAAVKFVIMMRMGSGRRVTNSIPHSTVLEALKDEPGIEDSLDKCRHVRIISPSRLAACHYLFAQKNEAEANRFVTEILEGTGLQKGDPVLTLRNKLIADSSARTKEPASVILAMCVKTWNARRRGASQLLLRFLPDEKFPQVV